MVQPSVNEAVGRVLLEAQYLGVPVVATRVGGIPEVVIDGVTGILVPSGDVERLADAVCNLLQDDGARLNISQKAKERIDKKFSKERMVSDIKDLYAEGLFL